MSALSPLSGANRTSSRHGRMSGSDHLRHRRPILLCCTTRHSLQRCVRFDPRAEGAMKRREFITLLGGAAAWPLAARGQQNRRPWRIAFPEEGAGFAGATKRFDAFRNGLRELGYTDDNSIIDRRVGNGRDELVALCQNMITHGADVIVAGSSNLALAAQEATKTVPI